MSKSVVEPVTIELPFPPSDLNPNRGRRLHWAQRARVAAQYREDCGIVGMVWRQQFQPTGTSRPTLAPPVEASVTFVVPDRRKRDMDNLLAMLKPAWDGLVDAGVLAGDDSERFKVVDGEVVCGCSGHGHSHGKLEPKVIVSLSGAGTT